jgi:hypothetical protein
VIAHETTVYVTPDFQSFRIAPPEVAAIYGWYSMAEARTKFNEEK